MNYLIACFKNGRSSESILWWLPGGMGYTFDLDEAGRYDENDPRVISYLNDINHSRLDNVPVPEDFALAHSRREIADPQCGPFLSASKLVEHLMNTKGEGGYP